jgi:hypothetical protein
MAVKIPGEAAASLINSEKSRNLSVLAQKYRATASEISATMKSPSQQYSPLADCSRKGEILQSSA